ncbi:MAG TPA: AAA family ATPase, partial [Streptosporangiaceae bacterium]|nr:AAA family ATPase [Streptosporangiaceae bacterium]
MRKRASVMVGRDNEFRVVEQALAAARMGQGGAVFVVGESGIGKSRLAALAADQGFAEGMSLLRGRGSVIGPMVPFRSLTEALMSLLDSGDPIDVGKLGPYRHILARLIPDWGPPPSAEEGGSPVALAEAVRRLTGLAGRGRGCLLVLDDMQDFDAETLAVVEYLADNLSRQPVLLLGTVRTHPGPALDLVRMAAQRGSGELVELHRLAAGDLRLLVASYLETSPDTIPDELVEHLYAGSEGIPLFAEQLLNEMLDDRLLVPVGDRWRVAGELRAKARVTLTRVMDRRLDVIGAEGRELLSVAAVLGRRFPVAVLQVATGLGDRALLSHLRDELISQLVTPDEETPDWYAFGHPMIRDALLALITPGERTRLTRRAAAAVQTVHPGLPGEWCQLAATLYQQAGDAARAGRLFADAGRRALALGAAASAVRLLDRALELLAGGGSNGDSDTAHVRADAFASLLYALAEAGEVERAVASAGQLEHLAGLLSPSARAQLHTRLAWAATVAG